MIRRAILLLALLLATGSVLVACGTQEATVEEEAPAEVEEMATPEGGEEAMAPTTDRTGAWLDSVVVVEEPNADAGVTRLEAGDIDVYAFPISSAGTFEKIKASDQLDYKTSYRLLQRAHVQPIRLRRHRQAQPLRGAQDPRGHELAGGSGLHRGRDHGWAGHAALRAHQRRLGRSRPIGGGDSRHRGQVRLQSGQGQRGHHRRDGSAGRHAGRRQVDLQRRTCGADGHHPHRGRAEADWRLRLQPARGHRLHRGAGLQDLGRGGAHLAAERAHGVPVQLLHRRLGVDAGQP